MKMLSRTAAFIYALVLASMGFAQQPPAVIAPASTYEITGVVVDAKGGQALPNATVTIVAVINGQSPQITKTAPDGHFSFHRLAPGKYQLIAAHRGYPDQAFEAHEQYSTAIAVGPELDTEHIVFRLPPEASIRGKVLDEGNEPVQNANVRLFTRRIENGSLSTQMARQVMTDDLGYYSFSRLPEGTYYLAVSARPWYATPRQVMRPQPLPRSTVAGGTGDAAPDPAELDDNLDKVFPLTFYNGALTSAEATAIDLQAGQSMTADINLYAVPAIRLRIPQESVIVPPSRSETAPGRIGKLIDPTSNPQPPRVELFHTVFDDLLVGAQAITSSSSGSDSSGRWFQFEIAGIAPGHYLMQVIRPGEGNANGGYQDIDLLGDTDLPAGTAPMATVAGVAQFNSAPPSNLSIFLTSRQTKLGYAARVDDKGEFRFNQPLMPGRYEITAGGAPDWYLKSMTASGARVSGRTLEISGSEQVKLSLTFNQGLARIDGTALRAGKTCAGVMILLVPRDAENNSELYRRDQSDSDGTFTLQSIVPGDYTLVAIENGWRMAWSDAKLLEHYLPAGETIHIAPGAKAQTTVEVQEPWQEMP